MQEGGDRLPASACRCDQRTATCWEPSLPCRGSSPTGVAFSIPAVVGWLPAEAPAGFRGCCLCSISRALTGRGLLVAAIGQLARRSSLGELTIDDCLVRLRLLAIACDCDWADDCDCDWSAPASDWSAARDGGLCRSNRGRPRLRAARRVARSGWCYREVGPCRSLRIRIRAYVFSAGRGSLAAVLTRVCPFLPSGALLALDSPPFTGGLSLGAVGAFWDGESK